MRTFNKKDCWDFQQVDVPDDDFVRFEPNFTLTRVKLSSQEALIQTIQINSEKIAPTITQNNIIYINANGERKNNLENTNIIINNIFPENKSISLEDSFKKSEGINLKDSVSAFNNDINGSPPAKNRAEIENPSAERSHKSSFRDKSPGRPSLGKKVSFNSDLVMVFKDPMAKTQSHFAKKKQSKGCCGGLFHG